MRRLFLVSLVASAWLGCNALLGIEGATVDPPNEAGNDAATGAEGSTSPTPPSPTDGGADAADASDAGPCTDTESNPQHCGRCGHDCLGGQCVGGRCLPTVLASDVGGLFSIAIDDAHVYWTNLGSQSIHRVAKSGGAIETLYTNPDSTLATGLAVSGGDVYFATSDLDGGGVFHCPAAGCGASAPSAIVTSGVSILDVADGVLTFAASGQTDIFRCTLPCVTPEPIATNQGLIVGITSSPGQVFWSTVSTELRRRIDGDVVSQIGQGTFVTQMVVVGDELVYAELNSGARVSSFDGGTKRRLLGGSFLSTDHVATRDGLVFFNDFGGSVIPGKVFMCPLDGGCPDGGGILASDQEDPRGIAVDETSVFWVNGGGSADAGTIMRLAR